MKTLLISILFLGTVTQVCASKKESAESVAIAYCKALTALDFTAMKSHAHKKASKQIAYSKDESARRPERYAAFLESICCISTEKSKKYDTGAVKVYLRNLQVKLVKDSGTWKVTGSR